MKELAFFVVGLGFDIYVWILLLRILLAWLNEDTTNPLNQFVLKMTNYPVGLLNRFIPTHSLIDTNAIILLILVTLIKLFLLALIAGVTPNLFGILAAMISDTIAQILNLYFYMILIVTISSWIAPGQEPRAMMPLKKLTNPILTIAKRIIPSIKGFDLSAVAVLVLIKIINLILLVPLLHMNGIAG